VRQRDHFSIGIIIYAACFFVACKTLFQLAYVDVYSSLANGAYGLIILHMVGLLWCAFVCIIHLLPRQLLSFVYAVALVMGMQLLSPEPILLHFWLHESSYQSRVSALQASPDGRVSKVLYAHATYIPSMPGGYLCATEIVYDNSGNIDLISHSSEGRASVTKLHDGFYLRYPPCG
jgi:hypothetical protein